jgi:hypothetical protein
MFRVVRINKAIHIKSDATGRMLRHGHENDREGVGFGGIMTWSDTAIGIERARMYRDLLNRGKP